ncbi:MAG TPA: clan AA aspartic protease [Thermoanaerobaculia bacterium]|nr:clan AA aspartic protease [Thermoanaerobaculia bacterium]
MIFGRVNAFREAIVTLVLRSAEGQDQNIEAVVDTGFNGHLTLPPDVVAALGLPFRRSGRALLGDGRAVTFDVHEAVILWGGSPLRIPVDVADTDPLMGMGLLYGHSLSIHIIENGEVTVRALPVS